MSKKRGPWRRAAVAACSVCGVLFAAAAVGFMAAKHTPRRYRAVAPLDREAAVVASTAMVDRAASLVNEAQRDGEWSAEFTQDEINAWLAVEAPEKHPELFAAGVSDVRMALDEDGVWAACRYEGGPLGDAVYSIQLFPTLLEPNLLAIRIDGAWAGAAPMPLGQLREHLADELGAVGLELSWSRSDGRPLLLARLPAEKDGEGRIRELVALEFASEAIRLLGATRESPDQASSGDDGDSASELQERQENRQPPLDSAEAAPSDE